MRSIIPEVTGEITISKSELRLVLQSEANRYMRLIFKLLAANQLVGYYPALKTVRDRKNDIYRIFPHIDLSAIVIRHYIEYEASGKVRPDKLADGVRENMLKALKLRADELGRAPLISELPEDIAYEIWLNCGTWNGALRLAGIKPFSPETLKYAVAEFGIRNASPKKIPKDQVRKLLGGKRKAFDSNETAALEQICEIARKLRRTPRRQEISYDIVDGLSKLRGGVRDYMGLMGIFLFYDPQEGYEGAWKRAKSKDRRGNNKQDNYR